MKIFLLTLFPKMIEGFFNESIVQRARNKGLVAIECLDLRTHAVNTYGSVDDRPYGGGVGMVLRVEPVYGLLQELTDGFKINAHRKILLTSPRGITYTQKKAEEYAKYEQLIIIAGHYEGVDERVRDYVDEEVSLGDFILTGGEIVAASIVDSVVRLIKGVLSKSETHTVESFFTIALDTLEEHIGAHPILDDIKRKGIKKISLLEPPHYTRPVEFHGTKVPKVLLSGNHTQINAWRLTRALEETLRTRPDLLAGEKIL